MSIVLSNDFENNGHFNRKVPKGTPNLKKIEGEGKAS